MEVMITACGMLFLISLIGLTVYKVLGPKKEYGDKW